MSPCTALQSFISHSVTNKRRCAGSNNVIKIEPVLTSGGSELTHSSIHCAVIRASKRSPKKLSQPRSFARLQNEDQQLFRRTEAAQRLQSCCRIHRRGLGALTRNRASFSSLRHSELDHSIDCFAHHSRSADCACSSMDVWDHAAGN